MEQEGRSPLSVTFRAQCRVEWDTFISPDQFSCQGDSQKGFFRQRMLVFKEVSHNAGHETESHEMSVGNKFD